MKTVYIVIFGLIAVAGVLMYALSAPGSHDDFARCLSEKDVVMYGADWCSHCQNQKRMFGSSFRYVNYVECPQNQEICTSAGVRAYPTWVINGTNYEGEQPLQRLSSLTGCPL
jgi:glutaredoxin